MLKLKSKALNLNIKSYRKYHKVTIAVTTHDDITCFFEISSVLKEGQTLSQLLSYSKHHYPKRFKSITLFSAC